MLFRLQCAVLLGCAAGSHLLGQIVSGSIVGNVRDTSQAVVAGATVTVTNNATNQTRSTLTSDSGDYVVASLPPGRYQISVMHPGFKQASVADLELRIDQAARANLILELGQVSESVLVQANAVLLQTENPTLGQVIEEKPIVDLPLNGRNFIQLATLSAGVAPATARSSESSRLGRTQVTAHVAGARGSFNSFLLDGMENRGARFGEIPILPSVDAIREFKIQRNFYSAEYGQNVGVISVSIKSGTNSFHGTVFEFLRNDNFDARQFFDARKPEFKLNQFGFSFGGPVIPNRTFFFGAYEGRRQRRASQEFAVLPKPAWLRGNFSDLAAPIRDPFNNNVPFAGNIIPANRLSPVSQNYNQFIPAPNTDLQQGNYTGTPASSDDSDQFHIRIDHNFSTSDTMFVRYSKSDSDIAQPGLLPYRGLAYPLNAQNVVAQETHVFGPAAVNTIKLGYSRGFLASALIPADSPLGPAVGFKELAPLPPDYGLTQTTITGFSGFGFAANTFRQWTNTYALSDTASFIRGRHSMSFGGDIRHNRAPQITTNGSNGSVTYSDRFTGFSMADYVLGTFTSASAQGFTNVRDYRFNQYAVFFQDDFKTTQRLTLNFGLRYEYNQPWREMSGSEGFFDMEDRVLRLAKDPSHFGVNITAPFLVVGGVRTGVVRPDFMDLAPRIGLAYRITDRMVIRSGYGIFYAMNQGNDSGAISQNPGATVATSYVNSPGAVPRLADTLFDNPVQSVGGAATQLQPIDPDKRTPYMQQWNLNIQRELPGAVLFEIGYIGSKGTHLMERLDINQARLNAPGENLPVQQRRPFPQFQSILLYQGGETSTYHAMTVHLERRFAQGFHLLTNYTFAKSIDTSSRSIDDGASPHHVSSNPKLERGLSAFDIRQRFVASALYELPFGRGKAFLGNLAGPAGWLVAGWQLNGILQLQTGNPFSVTVAGDRSNTGVFATQRPNRVAHGILDGSEQSPQRWFDTSAYVINPLNTFGNAGRNTLFQDGTRTLDLSLFKNNRFGAEGRFNLQIRAEAFNVTNAVNFGRPGASVNGANFGVVTDAGLSRELQFALKFIF
jgi:hypothetical protein